MSPVAQSQVIPSERIEQRIYLIRGQKVMLDSDLALLYQVRTKALNQAVQRNMERFPEDFMFRLTDQEVRAIRSHVGTGSQRHRDLRALPYAFTEHGVAMLSSVLRSSHAVKMNILVVRAFVKLREILARDKDLAARVEKLEANQKDHDSIIRILAVEIDELKRIPDPKSKRIN